MMRLREFDGIRGIAALAVVLCHLSELSIPFSFGIGRYGVDVFFILSGFVIFLSLDRQDSLINFYKTRFVRLFPIFWFCVLFSSFGIFLFRFAEKQISVLIFLSNLTMIPRQLTGIGSYIEGSYWTLECELFFYLLISLLYFKIGRKYIIYVFLGLSFGGLVLHFFDVTRNLSSLPKLLQVLIMRSYGILNIKHANLFLAGICLYLYREQGTKKLYFLVFIFALLCSFFYVPDGFSPENGKMLNGLFVLIIGCLFWLSNLPLFKLFFVTPILLFLGEISYPLYLIHCNLGRYTIQKISNFTNSTWLGLFCGILIVILMSVFLTYQIDIPLRKYLRKKIL